MFHSISKTNESNLVIILDSGKGEECRNFSSDFRFRLGDTPETRRGTHIDNQHHDEFTFFDILFDVSLPHARRYIPINRTNLIAYLILANLVEGNSLSFEDALILPRKDGVHKSIGKYFDVLDFFEDLFFVHVIFSSLNQDLQDYRRAGITEKTLA